MSRVAFAGCVVVSVIAAGCAAYRPAAIGSKLGNEAVAPQGPVIVRLVGQHQTVTVTSGPDGPLYTAQTKDGRTIVANATLAQLRTQSPELYQFIEPAMAADASIDGAAVRAKAASSSQTVGATSDRFVREPLMLDSNR
jgi:hypothetical protein